MSVLARIVEATRDDVARRRTERPQSTLERPPGPRRDFGAALRGGGAIRLIAEFKRRSPSSVGPGPARTAAAAASMYEAGGAAALSVLTNATEFGGSFDDLREARAATGLPVLCKDFIVDPYQVHEADAAGADAILLIVAALDDGVLEPLLQLARARGLSALVEVHDEAELERALAAGSNLVGVNNRDLATLKTDLATCERMARLLPNDVIAVAESGIRTGADLARVVTAGYHAALIGEVLRTSDDPAALLRSWHGAPSETHGTARER